jgi:hypothetical protein
MACPMIPGGKIGSIIGRFVGLFGPAEKAGELRDNTASLLAEVLRQIGFRTCNDEVLRASGLTHG